MMGKYLIHLMPYAPNKYVGDIALKLYFTFQKGKSLVGVFKV